MTEIQPNTPAKNVGISVPIAQTGSFSADVLPEKVGFLTRYGRVLLIAGAALIVLMSVVAALIFGATRLTRQENGGVVHLATSYPIQNIPLSELNPLDGLGLDTTQSLSVNGQLYVNNSLILAPISRPSAAQQGQLYFDRATNNITYFDGSDYVSVAHSGQIQSLQVALQSVTARIPVIPTIPSIPSDIATLGANNLFQGSNTFAGGVSTGELRVDGVTVLGATTVSSLLLSSPLGVASGGTGATTLAQNGVLIGQGTSPVTAVTSASPGLCLMSTGSAPAFGICPGGSFSGVNSVNGLSGSLTLSDTTANGTTLTIHDASTTNKGIARFSSNNFSVVSGVVDTVQNIATNAAPTFNGITVNTVSAPGNLTVSAGTNANLALTTSGTGALYLNGYDCSGVGGGGKLTVDAGGKVVCAADNDTATPGDGVGVTGVGAIDTQAKSSNGAVIVGSTIYLQTADASNLGLVSTAAQAFAGAKTFTDGATFSSGITVTGTAAISGTINTATITGGSLTATTVNDLSVSANAISSGGSLTVTSANNSNLVLSTSGTGALYLSGYNCSALAGGGKLTVDASGKVNCATDVDTNTDTGITTIVAGNGIQVINSNEVSVQLRSGYGLAFDAVNPYGVGLTSCATNEILKSNGSGWDCAVDNDTPTPGDGQGITAIGSLDGGTASTNGANISIDGSTLYLQSASALRNGIVTTSAQTFAGDKTFNGLITANGSITVAGGQTVTLGSACGAGQVLGTNGSGVIMCVTDGTGVDTGVTLVGALDNQARSANGAVIVGNSIYLQTADPLNAGLVGTGGQTFTGAKTFNDSVTTNGAFVSTVATGTAPMTVASTTKVDNLNADLLDGFDSSAFGDATAANQTTILNRIGTNADASGTTTVFARLASIDSSKIGGNNNPASQTGTVFARLAYLIESVGATSDAASTGGSIFARLAQLTGSIGNTNDAASSTGSVNAKLAYLIANSGNSGKSQYFAEFTTSGSWTAPAGVTNIEVIMVGGGGGGGYATYSGGGSWNCNYPGGGGGGGGVIKKPVAVTPGTSYPIVIGGGGVGADCTTTYGINNGRGAAAGGSTTFAGLTASGGGVANQQIGGAAGTGGGDGGSGSYTNGSSAFFISATNGIPGLEGYGSGGGGMNALSPNSGQYAPGGLGGPGAGRGGGHANTFMLSASSASPNRGGGGGGGYGTSVKSGDGGSGYLLITWWQ